MQDYELLKYGSIAICGVVVLFWTENPGFALIGVILLIIGVVGSAYHYMLDGHLRDTRRRIYPK